MKRSNGQRCLECSKSLLLYRDITADGQQYTAGRGHRGNGIFCTANCGFAWAVRWAKRILFWR